MTEQNYDVIIVGAGFGGIGAAIALKRLGFENFVLLDRLDDLGGTWYVNHYPGLACDVPTTTYSYFFEPNPNWSRLYSTGAEIKQYADDVADTAIKGLSGQGTITPDKPTKDAFGSDYQ